MKIKVYVYQCTNSECRNIQRQSRQRIAQMKCEVCGKQANLIDTEESGK